MWKHKNFINLQLCATFKHFFDAGTIGSGTVKFRHYSQRVQLATPQNVAASGTTVSWGAVENATSYEILVSGSSFGTVSTTSVDLSTLSGWASLTDGTYNITIVAKADGYRDSEPSNAVQYTVSSGYNVSLTLTTNPSGNAYSRYYVHTDTNPTATVRAAGSSSGNPSPNHLDLSGINELWLNIGLNEDRKNFAFKYSINGAPVQSGTSITITQDCNITIQVPWFD